MKWIQTIELKLLNGNLTVYGRRSRHAHNTIWPQNFCGHIKRGRNCLPFQSTQVHLSFWWFSVICLALSLAPDSGWLLSFLSWFHKPNFIFNLWSNCSSDSIFTPSNALSIWSAVGCGILWNRVYMVITIPGVQNPHCNPCDSTKLF